MAELIHEYKVPVALSPAGLISWYSAGGSAVALVTSWVAIVGGDRPRIRTAWHGLDHPVSQFWSGGDFVLNVPHEKDLAKIRQVMQQSSFCLDVEAALGSPCRSGIEAVAPLLLDCAVQIECICGKLLRSGFDTELCGDVVRIHRDKVIVNPRDIPDICAIRPLSPLPLS